MFIFALIIVSIGYFIYKWYLAIKEVNTMILQASNGINEQEDSLIAKAGLNQPCVLKTNNVQESANDPICDDSFGLTCVVGMYVGNEEDSNTGVCLVNIGSSCNTIYDCVPWAQGCISGICENMTETINFPCVYDSDCIGDSTCVECNSGIGPCKHSDGSCSELVNGSCPEEYNLCDSSTTPYSSQDLRGTFRFNHICDTSLEVPKCKFNISPKDQDCSVDSDCVQLGEGTVCYTGAFKTISTPDGILNPPTYKVLLIKPSSYKDIAIIEINFEDTLLTTSSFESGTMVTFVPVQQGNEINTISYGPYYLRDQIDNNHITIMGEKLQPPIAEFVLFPNKYIKLNESSYSPSPEIEYNDLMSVLAENIDYNIVFGIMPSLQLQTQCHYNILTKNFIFNGNSIKLVDKINVLIGTTEVRFSITLEGNPIPIQQAPPFTLSSISGDGLEFNVKGNIDDLEKRTTAANGLTVLFGNVNGPNLLDNNKGVCVTKLPPSANIITDSKYDLTEYQGNPCNNLFDNSIPIESSDNFCKLTTKLDSQGGPGSVCQFSRDGFDPLPCDVNITKTFEGIDYHLECLIDNDLTETVKNNPNFLNSSFSGICSFPVHDKFKQCYTLDDNCKPPYVCTQFEEGRFCDSRFDILQCNDTYSCPPEFTCQDGYCKSNKNWFCVAANDCVSSQCGENKLRLAFYNSTLDQDTSNDNRIVIIPVILDSGKSALEYELYAKSKYRSDNTLQTYVLVYDTLSIDSYLVIIDNPLSKTKISAQKKEIDTESYTNFVFSDDNGIITLWGWKNDTFFTLQSLYPPETDITFTENYGPTDVLSVDINNNDLLVTLSTSTSGVKFKNLNITNKFQDKEYSVIRYINFSKTPETYKIPYFSQSYDNLRECKYDLLDVNDTGLDIVCTHISENVGNPIIGVRHNVSKYNSANNRFGEVNSGAGNCGDVLNNDIDNEDRDLGCFLNPVISLLQLVNPQSYPFQYNKEDTISVTPPATLYLVPNKYDINTIYAFSKMENLSISGVEIINLYKRGENLYIETDTSIASSILENLVLTFSPPSSFAPFSFTQTSNIDNYGNCQSAYLQYPYWITDLQDLVVGDDYNPIINKIFYTPNRENRNYYTIVDMYTGYQNNQILQDIIENDNKNIENDNMYLFRFSSDNNEISLTVDETIPIKINSPKDLNRFAECDQTGNMFFLGNICSS